MLAACGIAALGLDHERFLLAPEEGVPKEPMARIAFEKAGIAKQGVPLVSMARPALEAASIAAVTDEKGAILYPAPGHWRAVAAGDGLVYSDAEGELRLPLPSLAGAHQAENAGLAIAMLRHQRSVTVGADALASGSGPPAGLRGCSAFRPGRSPACVRRGSTAGTIRRRGQ